MKIDVSKLELPEQTTPEFGDDEVGKIAAYCYKNWSGACLDKRLTNESRWANREIGGARKKTQAAWEKMLTRLRADPNMLSILNNAGLVESLNQATELIAEGYEPIPDSGGKPAEPHLVLAIWAADEFFPDWKKNPAAKINEALIRAGIIDADKIESIRVTLQRQKGSAEEPDWQELLRKL